VAQSDPFAGTARVILASASPRRRELLTILGISFRIVAADVDEHTQPGEVPTALVTRLAETKALTVARRAVAPSGLRHGTAQSDDASLVLAADTEVELDGAVLGKPPDGAAARAMLLALRGRAHRVLTGLALALGETIVWMRTYTDDEIAAYIATGRPLDKAGAYGIQDAGFQPVARINGCYTNVVGLPLCEVRRALAGRQEAGDRKQEERGSGQEADIDLESLCTVLQEQARVQGSHGSPAPS
jgi:nucleoside triphosphate pyrophosphatase